MTKVLIVEDDELIAEGMAQHLAAAGLDPMRVGAGEVGLARLRHERPDVLVLDLMLPGLDGWSLIEKARADGIGTPIIVVSARGTEHDRVHALQIGADDYLVKPFSMKELVARVQASARRGVRGVPEDRGEKLGDRGARDRPPLRPGFRGRSQRGADPDRVPALCTRSPWIRAASRAATSCCSGSGAAAPRTAIAPSTSASAGCARRSTSRPRSTRSSRPATASATSSSQY